jgi:hypothetical protein
MAAFTGCIAGALTPEQFSQALTDAGLVDISITETHRVHRSAASAIVRAVKPVGALAADADPEVSHGSTVTPSSSREPPVKQGCC